MIFDSSTAAIVTGGASGLGQATARALAAAGIKVAIFDVNATTGQSVADEIGGVFCDVDITSEDSVVAGFTKARAAHGQERILVHCAMTSRRGKTLAYDKEAGRLKRLSTEDYIYGVNGILVASYRIASLAAEGMAALDPLETVQLAWTRLREQRYDLFNNNCEHLAYWCKTGHHWSPQANGLKQVLAVGAVFTLVAIVVGAAG